VAEFVNRGSIEQILLYKERHGMGYSNERVDSIKNTNVWSEGSEKQNKCA